MFELSTTVFKLQNIKKNVLAQVEPGRGNFVGLMLSKYLVNKVPNHQPRSFGSANLIIYFSVTFCISYLRSLDDLSISIRAFPYSVLQNLG